MKSMEAKIRNRTLYEAGGDGNGDSIAVELERQLGRTHGQIIDRSRKGIDYIVGMVQKSLHIIPTGVVASELDEFTTGLSCFGATIGEAGVCLFSIYERNMQELVRSARTGDRHDNVESYLVRYPGGRIHDTIQDHMASALHVLSIIFGA